MKSHNFPTSITIHSFITKGLQMKIIVDVMSGDKAPGELIKGACYAANTGNAGIIMVGNADIIKKTASENMLDISLPGIEIADARDVISMEDDPMSVKDKKDSSMARSLMLLREGDGDAVVSAGNTGALYTGSVLYVGRIKGVQKAAIATVLPFPKPVLMLDCGANVNQKPENLVQFALMGNIYAENVMNVSNPRIGLLNNGTESHKGTELHVAAYNFLLNEDRLNFTGNVESKSIPDGVCDVLVTDGFTGNVLLKAIEGLGGFFVSRLKEVYRKNPITYLSAAIVKPQLKKLKSDFDPAEHGGAPFLGIKKPVFKAHGSSDAKSIVSAIRVAERFCDGQVTEKTEEAIANSVSNINTKEVI